MEPYDAIVIGAGFGGLAAGIRLALLGERVAILERHTVYGGLNSFYTLGRRRFDVGLHALTNWAPPGTPGTALGRILRQLRFRHADWKLREQRGSEILLPDLRLRFSNDPELFRSEVAAAFPSDADGFRRLEARVAEHVPRPASPVRGSARALLAEHLRDERLVDALLLPLLYYGSAREDDVELEQFCILYRAIFLEGLARPEGGIRPLARMLVRRFRELGGELRMGAGVRAIRTDGAGGEGRARGVELEDGTELAADRVLSSAGWVETMALCGREAPASDVGRLSFLETICVLDRPVADVGWDAAIGFFQSGERFCYRRPKDLCDVASGVLSSPDNFESDAPPAEGRVRLTVLANHDRWCELGEAEYARAKRDWSDRAIEAALRWLPDFREREVFRDVFTPRTIRRYTARAGGAVYGCPTKRWDGRTPVEGLRLVGTDQGYLGVIGAMMSGITIANDCLREAARSRA